VDSFLGVESRQVLTISPIHDTQQSNLITASCISADKQWIATADSGEDPMIVVWDSSSATPLKKLAAPQGGVLSMDISSDGMSLVTLSNCK